MKILIADDDRMLVQLFNVYLRAKGCEVLNAFDAMQALSVATRGTPDVIVLDIAMPAGNGLDALRKLKTLTKTSMVPVLVLTANEDPKVEVMATSAGANGYMRKPVTPEALHEELRRLTGR